MPATIVRKLEWDAGHRVLGHETKCKHLHGHRYTAEVYVRAKQLDEIGRVVDFSVIKTKVGGWIDENWDHNMILHPDDPILWVCNDFPTDRPREQLFAGKEPYLMPKRFGGTHLIDSQANPTAENMAEELYWQSRRLLGGDGLEVVKVVLWETPNCRAEFPE